MASWRRTDGLAMPDGPPCHSYLSPSHTHTILELSVIRQNSAMLICGHHINNLSTQTLKNTIIYYSNLHYYEQFHPLSKSYQDQTIFSALFVTAFCGTTPDSTTNGWHSSVFRLTRMQVLVSENCGIAINSTV